MSIPPRFYFIFFAATLLTAVPALVGACSPYASVLSDRVTTEPVELNVQKFRLSLPRDDSGDFVAVVMTRINTDPWPDLCVQRRRPENGLYVSIGSPRGFSPFELSIAGFGGFDTEQLTLFGDLDGDGLDDALVQKKNHNIWATVNRDGRFVAPQRVFDGGAFVVDQPTQIADINGDHRQDIIIPNLWKDILVAEGVPAPREQPEQIRFKPLLVVLRLPDDPRRYAFVPADIDGDGLNDWVIFTGSATAGQFSPHRVYAALSRDNGSRTDDPFVAFEGPLGNLRGEQWPPLMQDVDLDGYADIVVPTDDGMVYVVRNDGEGHFTLSDRRFCCIGGSRWRYHPVQIRTFDARRGPVLLAQQRGDPVVFWANLEWK